MLRLLRVRTPIQNLLQRQTRGQLRHQSNSILSRIKHEAQHYALGMKLLGTEVGISMRLCKKLTHSSLSRRELQQLKRTTQDLVRLVPFIVIVVIPFLELLLPVLLILFPNMLPSTFAVFFVNLDQISRGTKEKEYAENETKCREILARNCR